MYVHFDLFPSFIHFSCFLSFSFVLVYNKGYQEFDDVLASVSTKVKGYSFANKTIAGDFPGIWDVADYTVPPQVSRIVLFLLLGIYWHLNMVI